MPAGGTGGRPAGGSGGGGGWGRGGAGRRGATAGYVVDAGASRAVLELLSKIMGLPIDTSKLKEKAEETKKVISQLQAMAEQSKEAAPQTGREQRPGYIG